MKTARQSSKELYKINVTWPYNKILYLTINLKTLRVTITSDEVKEFNAARTLVSTHRQKMEKKSYHV